MSVPVALVLTLSLGGLTSCGSDGDENQSGGAATSSDTTKGSATTNSSGVDAATTTRAVEAGTKDGEKLGKAELPKDITIGQVNLAPIEVVDRTAKESRTAAEALGWKFVPCDGEGNPAKFATCMDTLLDQGVDAIILTAIEPAAIKPQLEKAKDKGVPVINTIGIVNDDPDLLAAQLSAPQRELGLTKALDDYMFGKLKERGKDKLEMSYTWFPILAGELRKKQLLEDLKTHPEVDVVVEHSNNLADFVGDTRTTATATLQAHPNTDVFWEAAAPNLPVVADVVQQKQPGAKYPDRPLIVGHLDDQLNLEKIRDGTADAIGTTPVMMDSWVAMDQFAEHFAREAKFERNATAESERVYGLAFESFDVITAENVPPKGKTVPWKEDVPSFFQAKWKVEFGGRS